MNELYMLTSAFMIIIIGILLWKVTILLAKSAEKRKCVTFVITVGAYILMDALFVYCFLNEEISLNVFRLVSLLFYTIYVTLPFIWYLFSQSYIGAFSSGFVKRILWIPYVILMAIILAGVSSESLWVINDTVRYNRGPWFGIFSVLNLIYYVIPVLRIIVILCTKGKQRNQYLFQALLFSAIPLIGVLANTYIIPLYAVYPFQPFCFLVGTLFAYFFLMERQKSREDEEHSRELRQALELESEALKRAKAAEQAKSMFLFNMSHDIRTPMNAIIGFTDLAYRHIEDKELVRDYLDKIKVSSDVLLQIINDVLDLAHIESGKMSLHLTAESLQQNVYSVSDMFSESMKEAGLEFIVETDLQNAFVMCDDLRMNQIAINLLGNAQKFTPRGGRVIFRFEQVSAEKDGQAEYKMTVKDNGIGMTDEVLSRVFEAFERERTLTVSRISGTGLGLSIVKNLVEMMGGTIEVKSEQGVGTEVVTHFIFQVVSEKSVVSRKEISTVKSDFEGKRLLLVEDNEFNREIAVEILKEEGFIVEEAENGKAAVEKVRNSDADYYDIILMDIQMPVMDGYRVTQEIRSMGINIPIVAMTANAFDEDRRECLNAGMNEHVAKPLDIDTLLNILHRVLASCN
ncbi:MAG: response regulator [Lachnospira sp.]|nr:response regulator [Lachnospira sp.]